MTVADPVKRFPKWKDAGVSDPRRFLKFMKVCADPDASVKYRRLKKLAFEAQDLAREQEFFAQEFRCRRFWLDKPFGRGAARFWFGWVYGGVSDFGRSLVRPFALWLSSIFLFAIYFLAQGTGAAWTKCVVGSSDPISEALYLAFRNAFLKMDWNDAVNARRDSRLSLRRRVWRNAGSAAQRCIHVAGSGVRKRRLDLTVSARASQFAQASIARRGLHCLESPAKLELCAIVYSVRMRDFMKIAIATKNWQTVSGHAGKARYWLLYDLQPGQAADAIPVPRASSLRNDQLPALLSETMVLTRWTALKSWWRAALVTASSGI